MHLEAQSRITNAFVLAEPAFQLFGCMRRSIVQNEDHRLVLAPQRFRNDHLLHKGLEIDKTLALAAGSVHLAIGDGEPGKEVPRPTTMVSRLVQHRFARARWARRLLALARLNRGFLIQADQPDALTQQSLGFAIGMQNREGALQKRDGIMDMLPGVIAPGANAFSSEPTTDRAG